MRLIDADRLANLLENDLQSFEEMISEHGKGLAHGTRIAIKRVEEQPTIAPKSPQPQWIPVEERQPEHYRNEDGTLIPFIVCVRNCKNTVVAYYNGQIWGDMGRMDVFAWAPTPEPYSR